MLLSFDFQARYRSLAKRVCMSVVDDLDSGLWTLACSVKNVCKDRILA